MRRSGRTTRMVDHAVQELFTEGFIRIPLRPSEGGESVDEIVDPSVVENPLGFSNIQRDLFYRIVKRLELEHYLQYEVDKSTGRIKLKQDYI